MKKLQRKGLALVAAGLLAFAAPMLTAHDAWAGPATDAVKAKQSALVEALKLTGDAGKTKLTGLLDQTLDYDALAAGSLGTEWAARTDAEKKEFTDLLKQLVRKAYEKNIKKTLDFNIEYTGEDASGTTATVKTKAVPKSGKGDSVEINYKLASKDGGWKVVDIVTESVSLVSSYRSQFTKIVKKDGFATLIQKMKDKAAKGDV